MHRDLLVAAAAAFVFAGCARAGGGDTTPPATAEVTPESATVDSPPEPAPADAAPSPETASEAPAPAGDPVELRVRVIHVAAAATKLGVTVSHAAAEGRSAVASDVAFGAVSDYVAAELPPGATELPLAVEAQGVDPSSTSMSIVAGESHTLFVYSGGEGEEGLAAALFSDLSDAPSEGMRVRFFNAVLGWEEVDVCLPAGARDDSAETVFVGIAYGGLASEGYAELPAGTRRLEVRGPSDEGYCAGRIVGTVELRPPRGFALDGQNLSLVAIGSTSGRAPIPRALLVCQDAPAESPACFRATMRAR